MEGHWFSCFRAYLFRRNKLPESINDLKEMGSGRQFLLSCRNLENRET